jgi:RNA polymerase sigma-70 factor (ECF subfamily)
MFVAGRPSGSDEGSLEARAGGGKDRPPGGVVSGMPLASEYARPGTLRTLDPNRLGDHVDRLYRAAWGLCGSRADAEDLVQETFARVLQRPRLLRSDDDLGYLLRVLRNTYFSTHRAASRRLRPDPLPDELDLVEDRSTVGPHEALEARELYASIATLPEPFRDALVAIDLLGLSYREAAQALRVREATITTRLHRGRLRLARLLDGKEAGSGEIIERRAHD